MDMDPNRPARKVKFIPKVRALQQTPQEDSIQKEKSAGQSSTKADGSSRALMLQQEVLHSGTGQSSTKADGSSRALMLQQEELHSGLTNADGTSSEKEEDSRRDPKINYRMITLPWKDPRDGDPDEDDSCDESTINSAAELGLLEKKDEPQLIMFKFPPPSALAKPEDTTSAKPEGTTSAKPVGTASSSRIPASAKGKERALPEGKVHMGKLMVYKSGDVKLKIGDTLFDVSPGTKRTMAQEVVEINTDEEHCASLGALEKNAVVTPDS